MFFTIAIMALFIIIMVAVDHRSRYTLYLILMTVGAMIALFFMILYINTFASYGVYQNRSFVLSVDAYLFSAVTKAFPMPFVWRLRIINLGISIFLFACYRLGCEFEKEYKRSQKKKHRLSVHSVFLFLVPFISYIFTDYRFTTWLHHLFWNKQGNLGVQILLYTTEYGFKLAVFALLIYSVAYLYLLILRTTASLFKWKLFLFACGLSLFNIVFYAFFFISRFSISSDKLIYNGFWFFENLNGIIPQNYSFMFIIALVIMTFCMVVQLSFRLDVTIFGLYQRRVKKNVSLLNDALGETLHSDKNLFFSMQILMNKISENREEVSEEESRLKELIDSSLVRTTHMLDAIRNVNFKYGYVDFLDVVDAAVQEVVVPENISLQWDRSLYQDENSKGYYDAYHLSHALVNILNNSVEAIQMNNHDGLIRIEIQHLFNWMILAVYDNGIGMKTTPKEVFSPHYSGKKGTMHWGLGLSYVYKVVKAHLGQVFIESKYHEYTWFYMMLPQNNKIQKRHRRVRNG